MPSHPRTLSRVGLSALVVAIAALLAAVPSERSSIARAASTGQLRQQIDAGQGKIQSLAGVVSQTSQRIGQLGGNIGSLTRQIAQIQTRLDSDRRALLALRNELVAAKARLAQLEAFEARAEQTLAAQLVGSYKSDNPDIVTVVLESRGFQQLLNTLAFAQRIRNQDVQIVTQVRAARKAVTAQAIKLGALDARQQKITADTLNQRDALAGAQATLVRQQLALLRYRSQKSGQLASVRGQVASLHSQLNQILAQQAAAAAAAAARAQAQAQARSVTAGGTTSAPAVGGVSSGGGFTFPMPPSAASPPGTWSLDQGVDISAPGGTPEYAVCSGTIVLHGIGGFGPWAPVLHCDSPVGGYSYVYYGHAGPANQLPVGTHVGAGQVMSEVGPGIVGMSTGPHIEIGFSDASGTPAGGASTMYSLLRASY